MILKDSHKDAPNSFDLQDIVGIPNKNATAPPSLSIKHSGRASWHLLSARRYFVSASREISLKQRSLWAEDKIS